MKQMKSTSNRLISLFCLHSSLPQIVFVLHLLTSDLKLSRRASHCQKRYKSIPTLHNLQRVSIARINQDKISVLFELSFWIPQFSYVSVSIWFFLEGLHSPWLLWFGAVPVLPSEKPWLTLRRWKYLATTYTVCSAYTICSFENAAISGECVCSPAGRFIWCSRSLCSSTYFSMHAIFGHSFQGAHTFAFL